MKRVLIIFILCSIISNVSLAQKEKYQSLFIYNFTKYIKWPDSYNAEKFIIGVLGSPKMFDELTAMANIKKRSGSGVEMEVQKYGSAAEIKDCNILFIASDAVSNLGKIDASTSSKPILIITDSPGMGSKGSVINFVDQGGKVKFELNTGKAADRGLVVSGSLTKLAIVI